MMQFPPTSGDGGAPLPVWQPATPARPGKSDRASLFLPRTSYLVVAFCLGHLQILATPLASPLRHGAACCKYGKYGKFLSEVSGLKSYKPNIYVFILFFLKSVKIKEILKLLIIYFPYLAFFHVFPQTVWPH